MGHNPYEGYKDLGDLIMMYRDLNENINRSRKKISKKQTKREQYYKDELRKIDEMNVTGFIVEIMQEKIDKFVQFILPKFAGGGGNNDNNEPPDNNNFNLRGFKNMLNWKAIGGVVLIVLSLVISPLMFGINDAGHRTVVQYPNGTLFVKFEPGLYMQWFGRVDEYNDVITFDFDKTENEVKATIDQQGIAVRYQDGGTGTVYGIARLKLPNDEPSMVAVHKEFRSNAGVASKLIKPTLESVMNHTAGLMTSEESYAEKRGTYAQYARDQVERGKYLTKQKKITTVEFGYEYCLNDELTDSQYDECQNVKRISKMIPVIAFNDKGLQIHEKSDLQTYGFSVTGFQMVDWGFEKKTLDQIATKRKATMAIITAKAEAEKSKQDAITAEQTGLANVVKAKYEQEVEKEKQVVIAEREKEVAEIQAMKKVEVARQGKLEAEQLKLAAVEYEQEQILRGQGDGAYKKAVMESDGYAIQKIEAWKDVQIVAYTELAKQKWSPEIVMSGSGESGAGGGASNLERLMEIVAVKAAKDLNMDMSIKTNTLK